MVGVGCKHALAHALLHMLLHIYTLACALLHPLPVHYYILLVVCACISNNMMHTSFHPPLTPLRRSDFFKPTAMSYSKNLTLQDSDYSILLRLVW